MTVLSAEARAKLVRGYLRFLCERRDSVSFIKPDVVAAVDNIDSWLDSQGTTINSTFPVGFRTTATSQQKALMVALLALMRYDPQFVKQLVTGGID